MPAHRLVRQDSEAWWNARAGKLTGSQISKVMAHLKKRDGLGKPEWGGPAIELAENLAWERKIGKPVQTSNFSNIHTERGKREEPMFRKEYENRVFLRVKECGLMDCGHFGASPDGLISTNGIAEIKSAIKKKQLARIKANKIDTGHKWQTHLELYSTNLCLPNVVYLDYISGCSAFNDERRLVGWRLELNDTETQKTISIMKARIEEFEELVQKTLQGLPEPIEEPEERDEDYKYY